jgi:predicted helicase
LLRSLVDTTNFSSVFISKNLVDKNLYGFQTSLFPLYLYPENNEQQTLDIYIPRTPNLNLTIIKRIAEGLGLTFTYEKEQTPNTFAPIDLLDYIYAVLHSPSYREKYKEFLKIDFPRIPAPQDPGKFWQLIKLGGELRQIHLLESQTVSNYITQYPEDGDNIVTKPIYKNCNVYINENQYFANVPELAWNFFIGGYQPAQKWLKDRKDRELSFEDILHYQKIVVALSETDRIMKEIDKIEI